jgi:NADPH-dependent 7-cyano-7-deazaguanine reductase QueF-like protein
MGQRRKAPNPKHDYMQSKHNAMILVKNIKLYMRSYNHTDFDIWCEKEKLGNDHIWVVRSDLGQKLYNLS